MYAVVGCTDCGSLWVLEVGGDSATCPRCGKRHDTDRLKHFAEAEDADEAREARAAIVANRRDAGDAAPSFGDLEAAVDVEVVDEATRLKDAGIDPEAVAEAGERAAGGTGGTRTRREVVLGAFEEHERPDAATIRAYAVEHGVPEAYVDRALEKLRRAGEISETAEGYRRL